MSTGMFSPFSVGWQANLLRGNSPKFHVTCNRLYSRSYHDCLNKHCLVCRPLHPVSGCFAETRIATNLVWIVHLNFRMIGIGYHCVRTFCIYRSSFFRRYFGQYCRNRRLSLLLSCYQASFFGRLITKDDFTICFTDTEAKVSQVNPSPSTHLLIYLELWFTALVIDSIKGIFRAVIYCFIRNVYGIPSCPRNFRYPFGNAYSSFFGGFYLTVGTFTKRFSKSLYILFSGRSCFFPVFSTFYFRLILNKPNVRLCIYWLSTMISTVCGSLSRGRSTVAPAFSSIGTRNGST